MRTARALFLSFLMPLVGIGGVGFGAGFRSVADLGMFVLIWAVVVVPLTVAFVLVALAVNRARGPFTFLQFTLGGLVVGAGMASAWIRPWTSEATILASVVVGAGAGAVGVATAVTAWYLAVHERAV